MKKIYHHIFGPVLSRRLGVSLGVDLVEHKTCSMNCLYCECGRTTTLTGERKEYVPFDDVKAELDHYFENHPDPDYITFSGSGEPTLNSALDRVIRHIKNRKPGVKVAVLTNASLFDRQDVRTSLLKADLVMPSLDAARQKTFARINRPAKGILCDAVINGLESFRKEYQGRIWLEILILAGINDGPEDIAALCDAVERIKPDRVQLNTLDRPGAETDILAADFTRLEEIAGSFQNAPAEIIAKAQGRIKKDREQDDVENTILQTIHRRPSTKEELMQVTGLDERQTHQLIRQLKKEKKIVGRQQQRGLFYYTVKKDAP